MKHFASCVLFAAIAALTGCQTSIVPLKPLQEVEYDETGHIYGPVTPATAPATSTAPATTAAAADAALQRGIAYLSKERAAADLANTTSTAPSTATAPSTSTAPAATSESRTQNSELQTTSAPATQLVRKTRMVDPNQAVRYAYRTNYDYLWQKSLQYLSDLGYVVDRQDYRLGIIITKPSYSPHVIEPWKLDQTDPNSALENTINSHQRTIRITISRAPNPAFYEVGVQVIVERQSNPSEAVGGPIGPAAGHTLSQGTDFETDPKEAQRWRILGHDPKLERKVIDQLFKSL